MNELSWTPGRINVDFLTNPRTNHTCRMTHRYIHHHTKVTSPSFSVLRVFALELKARFVIKPTRDHLPRNNFLFYRGSIHPLSDCVCAKASACFRALIAFNNWQPDRITLQSSASPTPIDVTTDALFNS